MILANELSKKCVLDDKELSRNISLLPLNFFILFSFGFYLTLCLFILRSLYEFTIYIFIHCIFFFFFFFIWILFFFFNFHSLRFLGSLRWSFRCCAAFRQFAKNIGLPWDLKLRFSLLHTKAWQNYCLTCIYNFVIIEKQLFHLRGIVLWNWPNVAQWSALMVTKPNQTIWNCKFRRCSPRLKCNEIIEISISFNFAVKLFMLKIVILPTIIRHP